MSFAAFLMRTTAGRSDAKRDAGLTTPDDIERLDDIQYGPDSTWNVLDVYRPKGVEGQLPVIVSVHGGGWVYGDKGVYQFYCMSLAQQGFAVVNFSYRLAPAHKFPAPLEDTNRVFAWVLAHADEYGFDTANIFAVGDSAGAHLLGLYCCLCTNPTFAASLPIATPRGFRPKAVALNCGVYRFSKGNRFDLTTQLMADFLPRKGSAEEVWQVSVIEHVTPSFPPAFVMTCEGDFLAAQALPFVEVLREKGVPVDYRYYGDAEHPLYHVFHCSIREEAAQRCNRDECDFFKGLIG